MTDHARSSKMRQRKSNSMVSFGDTSASSLSLGDSRRREAWASSSGRSRGPPERRLSRNSSIASRVESANSTVAESFHRLYWVALFIILTLIIVMSVSYVIIEYGIFGSSTRGTGVVGGASTIFTLRDTVLFVNGWLQGMDTFPSGGILPKHGAENAADASDEQCLQRLFLDMNTSVSTTSPHQVELVLQNMGLLDNGLVLDALQDYLREPQPVSSAMEAAEACLGTNYAARELACLMEDLYPWDVSSPQQQNVLVYMVNLAAVMDFLTVHLMDSPSTMHAIAQVMKARRQTIHGAVADLYEDETSQDLVFAKYDGSLQALQAVGHATAENEDVHLMSALQGTILGGVQVDIGLGHESNARVGLALTTNVLYDSFTEDKRILWSLGTAWADAYTAWSFANVAGYASWSLVPELLIPSVACAAVSDNAQYFVAKRIVSGALSAMHLFRSPSPSSSVGDDASSSDVLDFFVAQTSTSLSFERYAIASAMGESTLVRTALTNPSTETVQSTLSKLCAGQCSEDFTLNFTKSSPTWYLDDAQFLVYVGFVIFVTLEMSGLGMEMFVWLLLLQSGWTTEKEGAWKLAQFLFPILGMTAVGLAFTHNWLSLPVTVAFLWKFGFPETILYVYGALFDTHKSRIERVVEAINGIGTATHHACVALWIAMVLAGVLPPDRVMLDSALPLLIQHWFILLKYVNIWAYVVVELILEAYAEWIALSNMELLRDTHWTGGLVVGTMLFAHWCYLIASGLHLVFVNHEMVDENQVEHITHIRSSVRHLNVPSVDNTLRDVTEYRRKMAKEMSIEEVSNDSSSDDSSSESSQDSIQKDSSSSTAKTMESSGHIDTAILEGGDDEEEANSVESFQI